MSGRYWLSFVLLCIYRCLERFLMLYSNSFFFVITIELRVCFTFLFVHVFV